MSTAALLRDRKDDWARLEAEMIRLYEAGLSLVPLGKGPQGKAPLVKFAGRGRLPIELVLGEM